MHVKRVDESRVDWDRHTEFLVVGAGGCGLAAAVRAAERGVDVTVMEKAEKVGGKALVATNQICAVDSQHQRAEGIDDTPESYLADLERAQTDESATEFSFNDDLVLTVAGASGQTIDWLTDEHDVPFELHTGRFVMSGHSVSRTHYPLNEDGEIPRNGEPLVGALEAALDEHGVEVMTDTPMDQLVLAEDDDTVLGALYKENPTPNPRQQDYLYVRADHVLLACDGFGANRELVEELLPELADLDYWGTRENTGEAVRIARQLGLALDVPLFSMHGPFTVPDGVYLQNELVKAGAIIVNRSANRFMDCGDVPYRVMDIEILAQEDSVGFIVIDQGIVELFQSESLTRNQFQHILDAGVFDVADSVDELAALYDLDAHALRETIDNVNGAADGEHVEYGRAHPHALEPPFYAAKIKPMYVKARAGIKVDEHMRALREDGSIVEGLLAGGNASESLEAGDPNAYIPGMDLMTAYTEGRLAAEYVADDLQGD